MNMIFCRGCGKQIHETAQSCPHCGATQMSITPKQGMHWATTTSFISGIIVFVMLSAIPDEQWDTDTILGGFVLGVIPIAFGIYSLTQKSKNGRWMGITGLCLGIVAVLASAGNM
jgi:hypothetical protein